jgi:hypothetical protein
MAMGAGKADKISCARATGAHRAITIIAQQHTVTKTVAITAGRRLESVLFFVIAHDPSRGSTLTQTSGERRVER